MILLTSIRLTNRDLKRFGAKIWKKFYILDISRLLKNKSHQVYKKIKHKNTTEISTFSDLIFFLKNKKFDYLIDRTDNSIKEIIIKLIIKRYGIKVIRYYGNLKPESSSGIDYSFFNIKKIVKRFLLFFINKFITDIALVSGAKHTNFEIYTKTANKIFFTHSFDYNHFLSIKKNRKLKNSIVYLDQNFILHPDFKIKGKKPFVNKTFYKKLENFFEKIQKKYKCKIKIALHPKTQLNKLHINKKYPGYINKTAELIRDSKFVLAHYSTAINYAVLFNKPLTLLTSNELISIRPGIQTKKMSKEFNSKLLNIDNQNNLNICRKVDKKKYKKFLNNYIKHPKSENINTWKYLKKKLTSKNY